MDNSIESRRKKLKKELRIVNLVTYGGYFLGIFLRVHMATTVLPIFNIILILFNVDEITRQFIITLMDLYLQFMPFSIYIAGNIKSRKISKELAFYGESKGKVHEVKELNKEESLRLEETIRNVKEEFESLSRSQQMEVLNFLKENSTLSQIRVQNIDLDQETVDLLQDEFEEILFPSFSEKESIYTRKRVRNKNS